MTSEDILQKSSQAKQEQPKTKTSSITAVRHEGREKGIAVFNTSSSGPSELTLLQLKLQTEFTTARKQMEAT
jgi:hypothetical protein